MTDRLGRSLQPLDIGSNARAGKNKQRRIVFPNEIQRVGAVNSQTALAYFEIIWNRPGWAGSGDRRRHVLVFLRYEILLMNASEDRLRLAERQAAQDISPRIHADKRGSEERNRQLEARRQSYVFFLIRVYPRESAAEVLSFRSTSRICL